MNGCAPRLALRKRLKVIRKWPICVFGQKSRIHKCLFQGQCCLYLLANRDDVNHMLQSDSGSAMMAGTNQSPSFETEHNEYLMQ